MWQNYEQCEIKPLQVSLSVYCRGSANKLQSLVLQFTDPKPFPPLTVNEFIRILHFKVEPTPTPADFIH